MHRSTSLLAPLFGCLIVATTASHAANCSGFGFSGGDPAECGSSGVLTIAGSGASIHVVEMASGGTLALGDWNSLGITGSGTLSLSSGNSATTGQVVLSTGVIATGGSVGFSESLGTLSLSSWSLLLGGNSSATEWGSTWSQPTWAGVVSTGTLWSEGSELHLSSLTLSNPTFLTSGQLFTINFLHSDPGASGLTLIPEPTGVMLAISGGASLLMRRRRF